MLFGLRRVNAESARSRPASTQPGSAASRPALLPSRALGKTGARVTMLALGASFPAYSTRVLRFAFEQGIACFDNSHRYVGGRAEVILGEFLQAARCREKVFVMTKCASTDPDEIYEQAFVARDKMQVDTIDLYMLHGLGDPDVVRDRDGRIREIKKKLVKEKVIRFLGFSTHADMDARIACLSESAKGSWVDALLVAADPLLIRENRGLNTALDACAKKGVGLIAMKTGRGLQHADNGSSEAGKVFDQLNMTPHQAMQWGIYSDERFAAVCTEMPNRRQIVENAQHAREFKKPMTDEQFRLLERGVERLSRATCPGCDGSCRQAAGSETDFAAITRYLAYAEEDGKLEQAQALYADLPAAARDYRQADLQAAAKACHAGLDFEELLPRASKKLG